MIDLFKTHVSSLTEIQYLEIGPTKKVTHTNESMMLKMFFLCEFVRWTKWISWAIENNCLLIYKLFEFVSWMEFLQSNKAEKAQKIFSSKNHLHYCNCWEENNKCALCLGNYAPELCFCCSNEIVSSAWLIFCRNPQRKVEKAN